MTSLLLLNKTSFLATSTHYTSDEDGGVARYTLLASSTKLRSSVAPYLAMISDERIFPDKKVHAATLPYGHRNHSDPAFRTAIAFRDIVMLRHISPSTVSFATRISIRKHVSYAVQSREQKSYIEAASWRSMTPSVFSSAADQLSYVIDFLNSIDDQLRVLYIDFETLINPMFTQVIFDDAKDASSSASSSATFRNLQEIRLNQCVAAESSQQFHSVYEQLIYLLFVYKPRDFKHHMSLKLSLYKILGSLFTESPAFVLRDCPRKMVTDVQIEFVQRDLLTLPPSVAEEYFPSIFLALVELVRYNIQNDRDTDDGEYDDEDEENNNNNNTTNDNDNDNNDDDQQGGGETPSAPSRKSILTLIKETLFFCETVLSNNRKSKGFIDSTYLSCCRLIRSVFMLNNNRKRIVTFLRDLGGSMMLEKASAFLFKVFKNELMNVDFITDEAAAEKYPTRNHTLPLQTKVVECFECYYKIDFLLLRSDEEKKDEEKFTTTSPSIVMTTNNNTGTVTNTKYWNHLFTKKEVGFNFPVRFLTETYLPFVINQMWCSRPSDVNNNNNNSSSRSDQQLSSSSPLEIFPHNRYTIRYWKHLDRLQDVCTNLLDKATYAGSDSLTTSDEDGSITLPGELADTQVELFCTLVVPVFDFLSKMARSVSVESIRNPNNHFNKMVQVINCFCFCLEKTTPWNFKTCPVRREVFDGSSFAQVQRFFFLGSLSTRLPPNNRSFGPRRVSLKFNNQSRDKQNSNTTAYDHFCDASLFHLRQCYDECRRNPNDSCLETANMICEMLGVANIMFDFDFCDDLDKGIEMFKVLSHDGSGSYGKLREVYGIMASERAASSL